MALAPTVTVAALGMPSVLPTRAVPSLMKNVEQVPPPANTTVPIRMLTVAPVGAFTGASTTSVPPPVLANTPPLTGLASTVTLPPVSRPVPLPSYWITPLATTPDGASTTNSLASATLLPSATRAADPVIVTVPLPSPPAAVTRARPPASTVPPE